MIEILITSARAALLKTKFLPAMLLQAGLIVGGLGMLAPPPAVLAETQRDPVVADALDRVDPQRLERTVRDLVGFGTRHALSTRAEPARGIGAAEQYLRDRFGQIEGVEVVEQRVRPLRMVGGARRVRAGWPLTSLWRWPFGLIGMDFGYREPAMHNVIARLPGTDPERLIVVGAHFDSRASGRFDATTDAPGANDNASGTAALIELARILAPIPRRATIELVAFNGEELGLLGSRYYVSQLTGRGQLVEAMLNNDIVGGAAPAPEDVDEADAEAQRAIRVFSVGRPVPTRTSPQRVYELARGPSESDSPSRQLARAIQQIGQDYLPDLTVRSIHRADRMHRGGDQYPFMRAGFAAVRLSEPHEQYDRQHQDVRNENGRSYGDLAEHLDYDYLAQVTRLNLAALVSLSQAPAPLDAVVLEPGLSEKTALSWQAADDPAVVGYELLARRSHEPTWTLRRELGSTDRAEVKLSKDDWWFAIRAIDDRGRASLPVLATPPR